MDPILDYSPLVFTEIAFYKGNKKESQVLRRVFDKLVCVTRRSERFRHSLGVLDSVVAKYFATIVGWTVVSRPFVNLDHPRHTQSTTAEVYQGTCSRGLSRQVAVRDPSSISPSPARLSIYRVRVSAMNVPCKRLLYTAVCCLGREPENCTQ